MNHIETLDSSEEEILKFWQTENIYSQLNRKNNGQPRHIFYDIPYLVGKLESGKLVNIILKDVLLKHKAMSGIDVYYLPMWDCYHPVIEHNILKHSNKHYDNIDSVRLRELCRKYVLDKIKTQVELLQKMGVFGDWDKASLRDDNLRYELRILSALGKLLESNYLNKEVQPEYWCIKCQTVLSAEELESRQYKSPAGYVKFPVYEGLEEFGEEVYFLVQVVDLWKLTACEALAVSSDCEYVIVEAAGQVLIVQDKFISNLEKLGYSSYRILRRVQADTLKQFTCIHPLFGIDLPVLVHNTDSRILGTGVFNFVPRHSSDDYEASLKYKFNKTESILDDEGILTNEAGKFCGFNVFDVDEYIKLELEKRGYLALAFSHESLYPHCWTCHTPAIFRPVEQWFFSPTRKLSERTISMFKRINWTSDIDIQEIKAGIENVTDWSISRQRIWGVAIPAIYCKKCDYQIPIAKSIKNLRNSMGKKGVDAWFLPLDDILSKDMVCTRCGSTIFKKDSSILDNHFYSIVNFITQLISIRRQTNRRMPTSVRMGHNTLTIDIYCNQTLGLSSPVARDGLAHLRIETKRIEKWLQQFLLILRAVESRIPFITLHVNYPQLPTEPKLHEEGGILAQFLSGDCCADVLRLGVIFCDAENNLNKLKTIYNEIKTLFYSIIKRIVKYDKSYDFLDTNLLCPIDRLALSRLMKLIYTVNSAYSNHDFMTAFNLIFGFCQNELKDFYLQTVKDRLNASPGLTSSEQSVQAVLWNMVNTLVKLIAPITPFLAEQVWADIQQQVKFEESQANDNTKFSSVFLMDWPFPIRIPQQKKYERDWKQLLWFKAELTRILMDALHQGIIKKVEEADVVIYTNIDETIEVLQNYVEELQISCSIANLQILHQEPEDTQKLFQASNSAQIFFAVR